MSNIRIGDKVTIKVSGLVIDGQAVEVVHEPVELCGCGHWLGHASKALEKAEKCEGTHGKVVLALEAMQYVEKFLKSMIRE